MLDHPGYLGFTSQGVIAIHADWPMYPEEHGPELALFWLTAFKPNTLFSCIDDIDRCNLFLAEVKCTNMKDKFDVKNFHVAIWHEDLLELRGSGDITGVEPVLARKWQENRRSLLPEGPLYIETQEGELEEVKLPSLEEYEEEDVNWTFFPSGGITVTEAGRKKATELLLSLPLDIPQLLGSRIKFLFDNGLFDTCVRESCVSLEFRIKELLGSQSWGDALTEELITYMRKQGSYIESFLRVLRGELRTVFKLIRNDFMHNLINIDETQCRSLLFRVARVKATMDEALTST